MSGFTRSDLGTSQVESTHVVATGKGIHVAPGITLIIIGAILAFAVRADGSWINVHMVGVIFMLAGAAIIYHYSRERHRRQILTRVRYSDEPGEQTETVRETLTRETVYEGDEPPPAAEPPIQRPSSQGFG